MLVRALLAMVAVAAALPAQDAVQASESDHKTFVVENGTRIPLSMVNSVSTKTSGEVVFRQIALPDVAGRHILVLDDILDSGVTLAAIGQKLETERPLSVKICVLLRKDKARLRQVQADYVGFEIADEFVVGYGLDYMERYRNLPCIGVLRKDENSRSVFCTTPRRGGHI